MMHATGRVLASTRSVVGSAVLLAGLLPGCSDQSGGAPESAGSIRGELSIRVADYLDRDPSMHYFLNATDGAQYELIFREKPELSPGATLDVKGAVEAGDVPRIEVQSFSSVNDRVAEISEPLLNATKKPDYTMAVLMVHWGTPDAMTQATLKGKIFTNANSTNNFYREASYGAQGLTGDVFGWYQIPDPGSCNPDAIATSARNAATAAGVNLSAYKQTMYYFPQYSCSWAGLAQIGSSPSSPARDSWYNGYSDCTVLNQELAHNWGLLHSHSCTTDLPAGSGLCTSSVEYGDPFCPMGSGCYQLNAVQKGEMGWFGRCNIVTANASGTFNIAPYETPSDGIQALRVPRGNGRYLYVESRRPLGLFDTIRNDTRDTIYSGVLIHEGPEVQPISSNFDNRSPYLIDTNSGTSTMSDAALGVGKTYTNGGISITLASKSDTTATVQVSVSGGSGNATCMDGSIYGSAPPPASPATLFQHCNYAGWQAGLGVGDYTTAQLQALGVVNNDASSLRLASGYQAILYDGDNFTGTSVTYTADNSCFVASNFNDLLSSMRIRSTSPVKLFQHCSYGGWQVSLPAGDYTTAQLTALGALDNDASSLQIPAGWTVTLYDGDNFTGTAVTLTADTSCLVANSFNDKVSSLRIR